MKPWVYLCLVCAPLAVFGQKKEIVELQRDMALLQDQMRNMQRTHDEKLAQITLLLQQVLEASTKTNTSVVVLQNTITDRIAEQARQMLGPVAGVGTKVDQMADEFRSVRESVADLASRMNKLDAKLTDVNTAVATLRNPPAAPPPNGSGAPGPSAEESYQNAYRDMQGGQSDLALAEFTDYLKNFGNTEYAPAAQYYVGRLHMQKKETDAAIAAFDAVLEHYPENPKTADARLMKGRALVQAGKATLAAQEFREIIKRYPEKEVADQARRQLRDLGFTNTPAPATPAPVKRKRPVTR